MGQYGGKQDVTQGGHYSLIQLVRPYEKVEFLSGQQMVEEEEPKLTTHVFCIQTKYNNMAITRSIKTKVDPEIQQ